MQTPTIPADEDQRLAELDQLELLYTEPEQAFDRVTANLAKIFGAPIAAMSLIDRQKQFYKSQVGLPPDLRIIPRDLSICGHVVGGDALLVVDDLAQDPRFRDNPLVQQSGIRFYAGAPLRSDSGRPMGALCVIDTRPRHLTETERQLLTLVADGLMAEVRLRNVSRRLLERNRQIERDLAEARHAQRFLLPPAELLGEGFAFHHAYHPYDRIGGDFLDARIRDDGSLAFLVADVSGHGVSAALASIMVKTSFTRAATSADCPGDLLNAINRDLSPLIEPDRFITALAGIYQPGDGKLRLASAGHPYPLLIQNDQARPIDPHNELPLLVDQHHRYSCLATMHLAPGDRLLLYTDGALDAADASKHHLQLEGMQRLASETAQLPPRQWLSTLYQRIDAYAVHKLIDDVTLACLHVTRTTSSGDKPSITLL